MINNVVLSVKGLSVYYDEMIVLENINLDVEEKDFLGIIGPNGGGKSTLLKAILDLIPISIGEISIFGGKDTSKIGYVPQFTSMNRHFPISVIEVVLTSYLKKGLHPFFRYTREQKEKANKILGKVDLSELKDRQISELSGGEFQRLLIARALAVEPKILLLDEPTASVDPYSREEIFKLLTELNKEKTIIMVTHDLLAVSSTVKKIACLNKELIYHGNTELNEETVNKLYGCPVELIAHGVPHRVLKKHNGGQCCD